MKCTRHLCHEDPGSVVAMAAFSPVWASETTSWTPSSPRRTRLRRNAVQKASSSEGPTSTPRTWRSPRSVTPTATTVAMETTRPSSRTWWWVASTQR